MSTQEIKPTGELNIQEIITSIWSRKVLLFAVTLISALLGYGYETNKPVVTKVSMTIKPADFSAVPSVKTFNRATEHLIYTSNNSIFLSLYLQEYQMEFQKLSLPLHLISTDTVASKISELMRTDFFGANSWDKALADLEASDNYGHHFKLSDGGLVVSVSGVDAVATETLAVSFAGKISKELSVSLLGSFTKDFDEAQSIIDRQLWLLNFSLDQISEIKKIETANRSALPLTSTELPLALALQKSHLSNLNVRQSMEAMWPEIEFFKISRPAVSSSSRVLGMTLLSSLIGLFFALNYVIFRRLMRRPTAETP